MKKLILIFSFLSLAACNGGKNQTNIELIQDMMDQVNVKAQDWDENAGEKGYMRTPPTGTVPRGYKPMAEDLLNDPIAAGQQLKNPLAGDFSPERLTIGKKYYEIYCMVCHGSKGTAVAGGAGDGSVIFAMAVKPPPLVSEKIKDYPDGRIYHVIVRGQGVMGPYGSQIRDENVRWAIVNYVRSLQKATQPSAGGN